MQDPCDDIKRNIYACTLCHKHLPLVPLPIIQVSAKANVLIIGQAPGIRAHDSNKPWNDPSGDRLRTWLGLEKNVFYDARKIALVPMVFCYPGKASSGDRPPRLE